MAKQHHRLGPHEKQPALWSGNRTCKKLPATTEASSPARLSEQPGSPSLAHCGVEEGGSLMTSKISTRVPRPALITNLAHSTESDSVGGMSSQSPLFYTGILYRLILRYTTAHEERPVHARAGCVWPRRVFRSVVQDVCLLVALEESSQTPRVKPIAQEPVHRRSVDPHRYRPLDFQLMLAARFDACRPLPFRDRHR